MAEFTSGRLPDTVRPEIYEIQLTVNPQEKSFRGEVSIHLELLQPTESITLHALELEIEKAEAIQQERPLPARVTADHATETIRLAFSESLPAGPARLHIRFSGKLNRQMRGLYEAHADGEIYAFTQFEATDARRMFPCFDEPAHKARFRFTVTVPAHLTALSNMPATGERTDGETKTVTFDETPVMSTYLLALAAARLESKEIRVGPTHVAVWTLPGQIHLGEFALRVTSAVLPLLNDYFDLPYPYPKLDLVSVPDFAMGAMENWGLIFFRDSRLLLDEALASASTHRDVANVITHEIVHQWFGNLVTMIWWDDLWLNESFATWLACKIVDQWRPEWNSWVEFQQGKQVPLAVDALDTTRAINAEVATAAQIEEMFDALTYEKGAACLRMIEQFLGEEAFRDGIRRYIRKHAFENAAASSLWAELEAASGQPVPAIARDWFTKPGFPIVTARTVDPDFRNLTLSQRRFRAKGNSREADKAVWSIPFTLRWKDGKGLHRHRELLKKRDTSLMLPGTGRVEWIYLNAGESGFFRADYDLPLRTRLQQAAAKDLEPAERIGFLNHLWALSLSGGLPANDFLDALWGFRGDATRVVVEAMTAYLQVLSDQIIPPEDRLVFETHVRHLFEPVWKGLGWDPKPGEDDEPRLARAATLWASGALGQDEEILSELPRRLTLYWSDAASLDPTLATNLIRLCIRTDGGSLYDRFIQKIRSAATPEDRDRYLIALSEYKKPSLARKVLEFALSDQVRGQDVWRPVRYLMANPMVQGEAWNFIKANWAALKEKGGTVGAQGIIQGTRSLWRRDWREEVEAFFNEPANRVAAAERALAQALEFIEIGIGFKEKQQEAVSNWLHSGR